MLLLGAVQGRRRAPQPRSGRRGGGRDRAALAEVTAAFAGRRRHGTGAVFVPNENENLRRPRAVPGLFPVQQRRMKQQQQHRNETWNKPRPFRVSFQTWRSSDVVDRWADTSPQNITAPSVFSGISPFLARHGRSPGHGQSSMRPARAGRLNGRIASVLKSADRVTAMGFDWEGILGTSGLGLDDAWPGRSPMPPAGQPGGGG